MSISAGSDVPLRSKLPWLKRLGVAGFLFFLIKGLVWIGLGVAGWRAVS